MYFSCFLGLFLVFFIGCTKDKNEQVTDSDRKLAEAQVLIRQSDYRAAEVLLREAIDLNSDLERDSVLGDISLLIAQCHRWDGNYDSIPRTLENAILYYRGVGAQKGVRKGLTELARFYFLFGDYHKSMASAAEAAASAKILRDTTDLLEALSVSVAAARSLNKYDLAIGYAREMSDTDPVRYRAVYRSEIYRQLTGIYHASGRSGDIRRIIQELEEENDTKSLFEVFADWGEWYYRSGKLDSALRLFSQGLMYVDKQTQSMLKIKLLSNLGSVAYRTRHYDNARIYFMDALSSARDDGNISLRRALEGILVACDWKYSDPLLQQYRKEFINRASVLTLECESEGNRYGEMLGLALTIRLTEEGNDTSNVNQLSERLHAVQASSYGTFEKENIAMQLLQLFLDGELYAPSTGLLRYLVEQGNNDRIFELIEGQNISHVNRFFSRLTITTRNEALNNAVSSYQSEYRKMEMLRKDIGEEIAKGKNSNQERVIALRNLISGEVERLKESARSIRRANQNFGLLFNPEPPSLLSVRGSLSEEEAVAEYFRVRDTLFSLVIRKDTSYLVRGSQSAVKTLAYVREYNRLIGDSRSAAYQVRGQSTASAFRIDELSRLIGDALVEPVQSYIDGVKHIFNVPPPEYGMLPFHTLRSGNAYLIENHYIHYLPTAAVLLMSQRETDDIMKVTAVGHSGSTGLDIEYELRDIRSFYEDAGMIFNQDATFSAVENIDTDILHLGAEFKLDTDCPDNTTCVFSNGKSMSDPEYVPVGKLLRISAPQVIILNSISAESGMLWRYVPMMFLANGTPAVIATMWRGDRRTNRAFGEVFYTALKEGNQTDDAFHRAVRELIGQPESAKPQQWGMYYWFGW